MKRIIIGSILVIVVLPATALITDAVVISSGSEGSHHSSSIASAPAAPATAPVTAVSTFNKSAYSTTDPASLWVIVNKSHPLIPVDYAPSDITTAYGKQISSRMKPDLDALMTDAAKDGVGLTLVSGYRSYDYQKNLYASYVATDGQEKADRYSARPGYSEHQTGLAVDFGDKAGTCIVEDCYADLPEAAWLAKNAYEYGFILRYTEANQDETGYQAEAWHFRYVGRDLARKLNTMNVPTLEQFFSVTGGATYVP